MCTVYRIIGAKLNTLSQRLGTALLTSLGRLPLQSKLVSSSRSIVFGGYIHCYRKMSGDSNKKYNVVFVLGAPGSGKGTQCEKIQSTFGYVHLSAGELLRQECRFPDSEYGKEIDQHIKQGSIVPVKITCSLLKREMDNSEKNNFLVDGFPRNKDNLDGWQESMTDVTEVTRVLFFDCPDQVCIERCLNRGKTSGRTDDNVESLKKRIITYQESTVPIIEHFREKNLVSQINANRSQEEIFADIKNVFAELRS